MNPNTALQAAQPKNEVEFIPFGSEEKIKLNIAVIQRYVAIKTKSGALPSEEDCIKFMMLCRSRKLNPFEGDCFLQGYDGRDGAQFSLITAHQAFLKRAEVHPEFDGMESGVIIKNGDGELADRVGDFMMADDTLEGAWATVHFKNRKHSMRKRLNLRTFKKPFGRWNDDAAGMIVKCAEADALRSSFPTMLGGLYSREETTPEANISVAAAVLSGPAPIPVKPVVTAPRPIDVEATPAVQSPVADPTTPISETHYADLALAKATSLGLTEAQVIRYLQGLKPAVARSTQSAFVQLADSKLRDQVIPMFDKPEVVEEIRKVVL